MLVRHGKKLATHAEFTIIVSAETKEVAEFHIERRGLGECGWDATTNFNCSLYKRSRWEICLNHKRAKSAIQWLWLCYPLFGNPISRAKKMLRCIGSHKFPCSSKHARTAAHKLASHSGSASFLLGAHFRSWTVSPPFKAVRIRCTGLRVKPRR